MTWRLLGAGGGGGWPLLDVQYIPPAMMPDGQPAPFLMTVDDLTAFLRLTNRFPAKTIERMRKRGLLATQVGQRVLFQLPDVLAFLGQERERVPR